MHRRDFVDAMRGYDALCDIADPETEPYRSKYAARAALQAWVDAATAALTSSEGVGDGHMSPDELQDAVAIAQGRLGANYVLTEENPSGEAPLKACVARLRRHFEPAGATDGTASATLPFTSLPALLDAGAAVIEACNYLALLYSSWERLAPAIAAVRLAKAAFRRCAAAATSTGGTVVPEHALQPRRVLLDSLYTHTMFYAAQLYARCGMPAASTRYITTTLRRQLAEQVAGQARAAAAADAPATGVPPADVDSARHEALQRAGGPDWRGHVAAASDDDPGSPWALLSTSKYSAPAASLDRLEWARNALRLSDYYAVKGRWLSAAQCLAAGDVVLSAAIRAQRAARAGGAPAPAPVDARASSAKAALEDLPESLQRLVAESAVFWGKMYVAIMRTARDRCMAAAERAPDGTAAAAGAGSSGGGEAGPASAHCDADIDEEAEAAHLASGGGDGEGDGVWEWVTEEGGGDDPFSTMPGAGGGPVKVRRRVPASATTPAGGRNVIGSGADAVDLDDSDHEGHVDLLSASGAPPDDSGGIVAPPPRRGRYDGLPFTDFLRTALGDPHTCPTPFYGPASIGSIALGNAAASQVGLPRLLLPNRLVTGGFEPARDMFKAAAVCLQRGVEFLVLDGFVTDHITALTHWSKAYKYVSGHMMRAMGGGGGGARVVRTIITPNPLVVQLAWWEADHKRAAAMHGRRIAMLAPVLSALNPAVYMNNHKVRHPPLPIRTHTTPRRVPDPCIGCRRRCRWSWRQRARTCLTTVSRGWRNGLPLRVVG